jgi:hypothetical protein
VGGVDLTTQQKSRFRRAYRETYESTANHGQAVQAVYDRFSDLYGVNVDVLRGIVAEDVKKHPEEYSQRRKGVAGRQAPRAALKRKGNAPHPEKVEPKKVAGTRSTIQLGYGKPAKCADCGQVMVNGGKKLVKHKLPDGRRCRGRTALPMREYATCPVCLRRRGIRSRDGRMMSHKSKAGKTCDGTGSSPIEGRKGWHMNAAPAQVVRGGLPGLGKRG